MCKSLHLNFDFPGLKLVQQVPVSVGLLLGGMLPSLQGRGANPAGESMLEKTSQDCSPSAVWVGVTETEMMHTPPGVLVSTMPLTFW